MTQVAISCGFLMMWS